jgi:hypothetical protein
MTFYPRIFQIARIMLFHGTLYTILYTSLRFCSPDAHFQNIIKRPIQQPEAAMSVSSLDILNLSHSLKDVCEVNCDTCPGLTNTLRVLPQLTLIKAHLEYGQQLDCSTEGPRQTASTHSSNPDKAASEIELPDIQAIIVK